MTLHCKMFAVVRKLYKMIWNSFIQVEKKNMWFSIQSINPSWLNTKIWRGKKTTQFVVSLFTLINCLYVFILYNPDFPVNNVALYTYCTPLPKDRVNTYKSIMTNHIEYIIGASILLFLTISVMYLFHCINDYLCVKADTIHHQDSECHFPPHLQ